MKFLVFLSVILTIISIATIIEADDNNNEENCNPELCKAIRCYNVGPEACDPNSERYVKRDGVCHCCDTCVPI